MSQQFPLNEEIISATNNGLIAAKTEFDFLTGSSEWEYFIDHPEYMISSCIMRHIKPMFNELNIWPEVAPKYICTSQNIRDGRIDIVLDDLDDIPRVAIEVKTNIGIETDFDRKIKLDIERLCTIVKYPINPKLTLGLFAFIANRNDSTLTSSLSKIEKKVHNLVLQHNLSFTSYRSDNIGQNGWEAYAIIYAIQKA